MPSSMTHTYFGMDVYKKMSKKCQNKIYNYLEYYKLFCQGSDPFMFYHFFLGKRAHNMMNIQKTMHLSNTQTFFINTVKSIHRHSFVNNGDVMAYLYGYICHYYLDLWVHPFVDYKSGIFDKKEKNSYKYNGLHQRMEYNIDLYMIEKNEKENPYLFKIYQHIFDIKKFTKNLKIVIEESIGTTYHFKNIVHKYQLSIQYMKLFYRLVNYDPTGIKLHIYQFIDKISSKRMIRLEELSYHHNYKLDLSYLNLEHKKWNFPWDKNTTFSTSFFDLYDIALNQAIDAIERVTEILEKNELNILELEKIFLDLSFSTGLPCQTKIVKKYFEF